MALRRSESANGGGSSVLSWTSHSAAIGADDSDEYPQSGASSCEAGPSKGSTKRQRTDKESVSVPAEGSNAVTKKTRGGRPKGKLRKVPEMPLDILFNIFVLLDPLDVLRLARTTKALRNILLRKSAAWIWKEARSNVAGLPACPPYLQEPQYANLAFSAHCHPDRQFCLAPRTNTILWELRLRCCRKCMPRRLVLRHHMYHKFPSEFATRCWELLPQAQHVPNDRSRGGDVYSLSEAEIMCKKYFQLKSDAPRLEEFVAERKDFVNQVQTHSIELDHWNSHRKIATRERRKEAILKKLVEVGWGEELELLDLGTRSALFRSTLFSQAKDLTDRIWIKIKPNLVKFMEDAKTNRLKREKNLVLSSRRHIFKLSAADVYFMGNCKSIVEDTTPDVLVTTESFNDIFDRLPQLIEAWIADRHLDLLALLPGLPSGNSSSPLDLATTFFSCSPTGCVASTQPISYPQILVHNCTRDLGIGYKTDSQNLTDTFESLGSELWNHREQCTFFNDASRYARSIAEACGLDPEVTTSHEMDEAEIWVECVSCSDSIAGRVTMHWRKAVDHACSDHAAIPAGFLCWDRLTDVDTMLAKAIEATFEENWKSCAQCHLSMPLMLLKDHARDRHNVAELHEDDYYVPWDTPIRKLHSTVTLSSKEDALHPIPSTSGSGVGMPGQSSRMAGRHVHSGLEGMTETSASQHVVIELLDDTADDDGQNRVPSMSTDLEEDITFSNPMIGVNYDSNIIDVDADLADGRSGFKEKLVGNRIVYELLDD